jgi:hypothetical protein
MEGSIMSKENQVRPVLLLNTVQQLVFNALRDLPAGYDVLTPSKQILYEIAGKLHFYEPKFIVSAPDGRCLIVQATSHYSLSLSSMATLLAIKSRVESEGMGFLVLVPDARAARPNMWKEFDELRISYTQDPSNIVPIVLNALNEMGSACVLTKEGTSST